MSEQFKHYTPADFDKFDCVRVSKTFYFSLIYLLRAYIAWIMSVSNMQDRVGVIQFLYPDPHLFYLNLLSGSLGIFLVVVLSLRRPNAADWVKWAWSKSRVFIVLALTVDLLISCYGHFVLDLLSIRYLAIQLVIATLITVLCYQSKRVAINLSEFPEPVPEK